MKYLNLIFFFVTFYFFSCTNINTNNCNEKLYKLDKACVDIEKNLFNQIQQWNNGSIDGFMQGYWHSDSLKFMTKRGLKMGYDSVANGYKKSYNTPGKMGQLNFKNLKYYSLNSQNSIIQTTGTWHVIQKNKTDSGMFSLFLKPINGNWKIFIDHTW